MKRLFIIGNGFDIAHGLNTRYSNFMDVINKELEGLNQTMVSGSDNVEIQNVDAWHRKDKQKWYNNFVISPQVGVGVGMINKKLDVYVGVGVGYKF